MSERDENKTTIRIPVRDGDAVPDADPGGGGADAATDRAEECPGVAAQVPAAAPPPPEPPPVMPVVAGAGDVADDEDPVIVSMGEEDDDEDDGMVVVSIDADEESDGDAEEMVPRVQLMAFGREKLRLEGELKKAQGDLYQARADARQAGERETVALEQLKAEAANSEDLAGQLARSQAEFQNYRRRMERQREEALRYANADLLEALLPVLDNFDRAMAATPTAEAIGDFHKGIELIRKQLFDSLSSCELTPVDALGKPFDPNLHEAVTSTESATIPPDHVAAELRRGYFYKDRLLRPVMVAVAVAPEAAAPEVTAAEEATPEVAGESDIGTGPETTAEAGPDPAGPPADTMPAARVADVADEQVGAEEQDLSRGSEGDGVGPNPEVGTRENGG